MGLEWHKDDKHKYVFEWTSLLFKVGIQAGETQSSSNEI